MWRCPRSGWRKSARRGSGQPLDIDELAAATNLGQRPALLGRVRVLEIEPLEFAAEPEDILLGADGGLQGWGFGGEPEAQPEGQLFEARHGTAVGHYASAVRSTVVCFSRVFESQ